MDRLEQTRLSAADHLGNVINTFITCDDRKVRRSILFDAVDAITKHTIAVLVTNPDATLEAITPDAADALRAFAQNHQPDDPSIQNHEPTF